MNDSLIEYRVGIPERDRRRAADLVEEAFGDKLRFAIPNDLKRAVVLAAGLRLQAVIGAYDGDRLVGVAGIKYRDGAVFEGITLGALRKALGLGAVRAALVLHLLDRAVDEGTVRIDMIAVDARMRGRGIGSGLLSAVIEFGCTLNARRIELDVVDTNPGAHRLYLREGFVDCHTDKFPLPASWLGFQSSTTMYRDIDCSHLIAHGTRAE